MAAVGGYAARAFRKKKLDICEDQYIHNAHVFSNVRMGLEIYRNGRSFRIRPMSEGGCPQPRATEGPTHIKTLDDSTPTMKPLYKLVSSKPTFLAGCEAPLRVYFNRFTAS